MGLGAAYLLLIFASLAVLLGVGDTLAEVRRQGYLADGFERSVLLLLAQKTRRFALAGLALGASCVAAAGLLRFLTTTESPILSLLPARSAWLLSFPCALVLLGVRAIFWGAITDHDVWIFLAAAVLWSALWLGLSFLEGRSGDPERFSKLWFVFLCGSLVLAGGLLKFSPGLSERFSRREPLLSLAAMLAIASYLVVRFPVRRVAAEGPLLRAPRGVGMWLWLALLLLPALSAFWLGFRYPAAAADGSARNLVIIGIDTLRGDYTFLNPRRGDLTPSLQRLADRGTAFGRAVSQAPWTLPAFASVMTGRYPREHGAYSLTGSLRASEYTLAEILREAGFRTGAVVSHTYVSSWVGMAQGFDHFDQDNVLGHWEITSHSVTDAAIGLLDRLAGGPFFLYVHYFDPHYEYRDHEGWDLAGGYRGWLRDDPLDLSRLRRVRHLLGPEDLQYLRDLYAEEVAYTDRQIGRLLSALAERQLDRSTGIVVLADHGEEFMERGWLGHTISLHDEATRVPLIVALPGPEPVEPRVEETVETRAVFGTVLEFLGVDSQRFGAETNLLPLIRGTPGASENADRAFSEVWLPDARLASGKRVRISAVESQGWKLIQDHGRGVESLFDLRRDPDAQHDRSRAEPDRLAETRRLLDAWLAEMEASEEAGSPRVLTEEEEEQLRALGYL